MIKIKTKVNKITLKQGFTIAIAVQGRGCRLLQLVHLHTNLTTLYRTQISFIVIKATAIELGIRNAIGIIVVAARIVVVAARVVVAVGGKVVGSQAIERMLLLLLVTLEINRVKANCALRLLLQAVAVYILVNVHFFDSLQAVHSIDAAQNLLLHCTIAECLGKAV